MLSKIILKQDKTEGKTPELSGFNAVEQMIYMQL